MPHDVAVPENIAEVRSSIGERVGSASSPSLELRRRAIAYVAKVGRHPIPTRTIPFPLFRHVTLPIHAKKSRVHEDSDYCWSA
jgi:hypothetical protein